MKKALYLLLGLAAFGPRPRLRAQTMDYPVRVALGYFGEAYSPNGGNGNLYDDPASFRLTCSDSADSNDSGARAPLLEGTGELQTNKAVAWVRPGQDYHMTITGDWLNTASVEFTPPPGYEVILNDNAPALAITEAMTDAEGASETFTLRVVPVLADPGMRAGESSNLMDGKVLWRLGLGWLKNGRSAGTIAVLEPGTSDWGAANIFTTASLVYEPPTEEVPTYWDSGGALRQVYEDQAFTDIVTTSATSYEIRFYNYAQVQGPGFPYTFSGSPYVTYAVTQTSTDGLKITKTTYDTGGNTIRTESTTLAYDSTAGTWAKTGWVTDGQTPLANDNRTESVSGSGVGAVRTENATVSNAGGVALQGQKTYQEFNWGEELTQKIGDSGDSANQAVTSYAYYATSGQAGYGSVQSIVSPGGGWVLYDYYDSSDFEKQGQVYHLYRPFGNSPASPTADPTQGEVTTYDYVADWTGREDLPSSIITTVSNVTVAQAAISYDFTSVQDDGQQVVVATRNDYTDATHYLTTVTKTFRDDVPSPLLRSMPWSVQHPDGTQESYAYDLGDYNSGTGAFTPDANGVYTRVSVIHGTTNASAGAQLSTWGSFTLDSLYVTAGQSTAQVTIRDYGGFVARTETDVCSSGTTFVPVSWTDYSYDTAGHLTGTTSSNGATTSASYTGDQLMSQTDAAGTQTAYTYDVADRVSTATKKGVSGTGSYAEQNDLTTAYTAYDAAGDVLTEVVGGTLTTQYQYDQGGRLIQTTAPGGYVTSYSYPNGGRDLSTTFPGGATKIVTNQLDGTPAKVEGSAQVAVYYSYAANSTGLFVKQYLGSASSGNWASTQTDRLGRKTLTAVPDPSGNSSEVDTLYAYNSLGQLSETSVTGIAPTFYGYDVMGALELTVLDADGGGLNDTANPNGTDRIAQSDTSYTNDGTNWWLTTTKAVYVDGSVSPKTVNKTAALLTGLSAGLSAETDTTDIAGNVTKQQTAVNAASQLVTITTTTTSGISNRATQVAYNGLLVSNTDVNGVTRTYGYDSLGRPVQATDPRTGAINTTYESNSSQVLRTNYADGTLIKSYAYGADGRVASVTDANNDVVNYSYDPMGDVLTVSGNGAIPVTNTYDSFGRLATEATTGQAGTGTTTFGYAGDLPLLATRTDAQGNKVATTYDSFGRVLTRVDARNIKTTYAYDPETGDLTGRSYTNDPSLTPAITYTYNRTGALKTVTDAAGGAGYSFAYDFNLSLQQETLPAFYGANRTLNYTYDTGNVIGRLTGAQLGNTGNGSADQTTGYAYDPATGRLSSVTAGGAGQTSYAFNYAYTVNSDLLVASVANPSTGYTQNYTYENTRDWVQQTKAIAGTNNVVQAQFDYTYTSLGQRLTMQQSGAAFAAYGSNPVVYTYGYDPAGQLTTAFGGISSVSLSGRQYVYGYDSAGNRVSANHTTVPALAEGYTLNTLNQISEKENTTVAVQGSANATGVLVTANGVTTPAGQAGGYWGTDMALGNASGPATGTVNILAGLIGGGPGGTDVVTSASINAFLPAQSETMTWDKDGNLYSDGTWDYTWNAENELVTMTNLPAQAAGVAAETIQFSYDYLGRRIKKAVTVNGTTTERHYICNGWNVMAELDASGNVLRHFIWGLDLSGTMDGAGGVGGLLMIQDSGSTYFPGYDANGNVATLTTAATGALAATYEYSPFGELLQASGSYAALNPFRWSTKWCDAETGYAYYGYRYYSPRLGRFLNQDPIQEKGGINLYGFCGNDPIDHRDYLGQDDSGSMPAWQSQGFASAQDYLVWSARTQQEMDDAEIQSQTEITRSMEAANAVAAARAEADYLVQMQAQMTAQQAAYAAQQRQQQQSQQTEESSPGSTSASGATTPAVYWNSVDGKYHDANSAAVVASANNAGTSNSSNNFFSAVGGTVLGLVSSAGSEIGQAVVQGAKVVGTAIGATEVATAAAVVAILSISGDSQQRQGSVTVYRVWGGAAGPYGPSWTPQDPQTDPSNFRNLAGLPNRNTGEYLTTGTLVNYKGVVYRPAVPMPAGSGGTTGSWPEYIVPNPQGQITGRTVTPLPPPIRQIPGNG